MWWVYEPIKFRKTYKYIHTKISGKNKMRFFLFNFNKFFLPFLFFRNISLYYNPQIHKKYSFKYVNNTKHHSIQYSHFLYINKNSNNKSFCGIFEWTHKKNPKKSIKKFQATNPIKFESFVFSWFWWWERRTFLSNIL